MALFLTQYFGEFYIIHTGLMEAGGATIFMEIEEISSLIEFQLFRLIFRFYCSEFELHNSVVLFS